MSPTADTHEGHQVLQQVAQFLHYLAAVSREVGPSPVRDVDAQESVIYASEVPTSHHAVHVGPSDGRAAWLTVGRVARPPAVAVTGVLASELHDGGLLDTDSITHPDKTPRLSPAAVADRIRRLVDSARTSSNDEEVIRRRYGLPPTDAEADGDEPAGVQFDGMSESERLARELRASIRRIFESWLNAEWRPWVEHVRPDFQARHLYERLYAMLLALDRDSASLEVVFGHAVLCARSAGTLVHTPLVVTPMTMRLDDRGSIVVEPDGDTTVELDALEGLDMPGLPQMQRLRDRYLRAPLDPWDDQERLDARTSLITPLGKDAALVDRLPDDVTVAMRRSVEQDIPAQLDDGWALFIRTRPQREERFYKELAEQLHEENRLPEALASIITDKDAVDGALRDLGEEVTTDDGSAQRLLMPLPANEEQRRIVRQLAHARGVTVQGPPGTGKSHTIVNLLCHLVAQGKRVLVTAKKEQALEVLRDKIPEDMRDLSIAVLGSTPAAVEQLRGTAQRLQDSLASLDVQKERRHVGDLGHRVDELRRDLAHIDAALKDALRSESEEYELPTGPRGEMQPARAFKVAQWLADNSALDVIPDRLASSNTFPLKPAEFAELLDLVRSVDTDDARASLQDLPDRDVAWLPTGADLRTQWDRQREVQTQVGDLEEQGLRIEAVDNLPTKELDDIATKALHWTSTADELHGAWEDRLLPGIAAKTPAAMSLVRQNNVILKKANEAQQAFESLMGHRVAVPDGDPNVQLPLIRQWAERLSHGRGVPHFGHKDLRAFSNAVRIDDYPLSAVKQLDLVVARIHVRAALRELHTLARQVYPRYGIPEPTADDSYLVDAERLAQRIISLYWWGTRDRPAIASVLAPLVSIPDVAQNGETLRRAARLLGGASIRRKERELTEKLTQFERRMKAEIADRPHSSHLWDRLLEALRLRDAEQWDAIRAEAERLHDVRQSVLRRRELADRLRTAGAKRWAESIVRGTPWQPRVPRDVTREAPTTVDADHEDDEPERATLAWHYAQARTWLQSLHAKGEVRDLMARSHAESAELKDSIVELASRSARLELKTRQKDRNRQALSRWLTDVRKVGKGTGKNAPRWRSAAREEMPVAMAAIPVWIMPIYRVMENFDPRRSEKFDVVIVDESSQCDVRSVGVLALGAKCVVVGDDQQTSPEGAFTSTDRIAELQDQIIPDLPGRRVYTLDTSLYNYSEQAFSSTILLREHFRCVPPIIDFCNRFYHKQILPLRAVTLTEIGDPLRPVHVENATSEKGKGGRRNEVEAQCIVQQIVDCTKDPAYAGLTFGVVSMMSGPQSQLIQDLLMKAIGPEEWASRKLRVGNPPDFQGDERDVVFLSMVAHDNSFSATKLMYRQWVNVAVSRARDQLWVFYSMDPATLNHQDHRRELIEYATEHQRVDEDDSRFGQTESKFERDVLEQILAHGWEVEPQHKVGRYRIDFVVTAAPGARLAIECDGDRFHGPEQFDDDVKRQRVLERLGWEFWRIRASEYYWHPDTALDPLWQRLKELREEAEAPERERRAREKIRRDRELDRIRLAAASENRTGDAPESADVKPARARTGFAPDQEEAAPASAFSVASATSPMPTATPDSAVVAEPAPTPTNVNDNDPVDGVYHMLFTPTVLRSPDAQTAQHSRAAAQGTTPSPNPTSVRLWAKRAGYWVATDDRPIPQWLENAYVSHHSAQS